MTTTDATRLADLRCAENLLQCFCREIAAPSGTMSRTRVDGRRELRVTLLFTRKELRVRLARASIAGSFEIEAPVRVATLDTRDAPEETLDALALCRLLVEETSRRFGAPSSAELEPLVVDSRAVTAFILARAVEPRDDLLGSEQSLTYGHPFHPSPKARIGFDLDDLARWSPEVGASFRVHGVAARASMIEGESLDAPFAAHLRDAIGDVPSLPGFVVLPLHPWEARNMRESPAIRELFARGDLVDVGPIGEPVFATSSVRTVMRPSASAALKLSLRVRITNCIRDHAPNELRGCLQVTRWAREERARLEPIAPAFRLLDEVGWATIAPVHGDAALGAPTSAVFASLVRDLSPVGDDARVAASLFGDRAVGRGRLARLLPASRREDWFRGYVDALLPPMLHLFFDVGLMFEPHLQNVLVAGFAAESIQRVYLRDFDNVRVVDGVFDRARLAAVPREVASELIETEARAWERLVYCLFVNDLAEVAAALADGDKTMEIRLWRAIHDALGAARARIRSPHGRQRIDELCRRATLPTKANFVTRVFDLADRDAPFVAAPNPLASVARAERWTTFAVGADATGP